MCTQKQFLECLRTGCVQLRLNERTQSCHLTRWDQQYNYTNTDQSRSHCFRRPLWVFAIKNSKISGHDIL